MNNKEIRYTIDSKDRVRQWECWYGVNEEGKHGIFYTDGLVDGKMKDPIFKEAKEKNVGKANYLSPEAQAKLMVDQEVGKKERSNYFITPELARSNKLWLPMLCPSGMKWADYKTGGSKADEVTYPSYASPKLDGARCNIFLKDGEVYAQTRSGKEWLNIDHIKESLIDFFKANPTIILDGELYNHAYKDNFEDLMSIIKKQKPTIEQRQFSKENVQYHIYDFYDLNDPKLSANSRIEELVMAWFSEKGLLGQNKYCVEVDQEICANENDFDKFHHYCLKHGYEGSILRLDQEYKVDGRAKQLLKRKEIFDCECEILDVIEGEGTNKGIAAKVIIDITSIEGIATEHQELISHYQEEGSANSQDAGMAKGWDHDKCRNLLERKKEVIGKMATIEYFEVTGHGVLRFPKMKSIRDYE